MRRHSERCLRNSQIKRRKVLIFSSDSDDDDFNGEDSGEEFVPDKAMVAKAVQEEAEDEK